MRFYIDTLGCQKNTVDSEALHSSLLAAGHCVASSAEDADVMVVNTCGFIDVAKQQSIDHLLKLGAVKKDGQLLIAAGCLSQRYAEELRAELPEVDALVGVDAWKYVPSLLATRPRGKSRLPVLPVLPPGAAGFPVVPRVATGPSADIKISEGCNYGCTFCAIPIMKGKFRSKPLQSIVVEARQLVAAGVKEAILVSQDSTAYGMDQRNGTDLGTLLDALANEVPELPWVRVMYMHPDRLNHKLIQRLPAFATFCHYIDIPVQHAHPDVLRRMHRGGHPERTEELLLALRASLPDIALRTSFIVGFPGETDEEYEALVSWTKKMKFDHAGVFTYSPEDGTPGADMPDHVTRSVKNKRRQRLMRVQERISSARNARLQGQSLTVLIEGNNASFEQRDEPPVSVGRSYRDAPEVDGTVIIQGHHTVGAMLEVRVTGSTSHDLIGTPA